MKIQYLNNPSCYVNVRELMKETLPRPKHKSRFVSDGKQLIPIITVETDI